MTASVLNNQQFFFLAAVAAAGVGYLYMKRKDIGAAVNPVSDKNLAYTGVNAVGQSLASDENWTLGTWMFEVLNPQAIERERQMFMN